MNQPSRIALAVPDAVPWGMARFFSGVNDYAREHGRWILVPCPIVIDGSDDFPLDIRRFKNWKGDGIIIKSDDLKLLAGLKATGIPVVNIGTELSEDCTPTPRVSANHFEIGRHAARHLIERGFRNLAFHGVKGRWYSNERFRGFAQEAEAAGVSCTHFSRSRSNRDALWTEPFDLVNNWLRSLEVPTGIFAVNDYRSLILLDGCQRLGLKVPDEIAIIGVDNNLSICESCRPSITSICINGYQIGYRAAQLLDELMSGHTPPSRTIQVDPGVLVSRESTDILHVRDPFVKKAIDYMESNYGDFFKMNTLAESVGTSRRTLEMKFRAERGTSPASYLTSIRLKRAMAMLTAPGKLSLENVAKASGFRISKNLRAALRKAGIKNPRSVSEK
jgi:LacI family transcriptional regulator